jgi:hypothetical protein
MRQFLITSVLLTALIAPASAQSNISVVGRKPATSIPIGDKKGELLQHVMDEFYGPHNKTHSCWLSKHKGVDYCMKPLRLDHVGSQAFIVIDGGQLQEDGTPCDYHPCTGALGLIVLTPQGSTFGLIAKNDLYEEFGSFGTVGQSHDFAVRELGPNGRYGWIVKGEATGAGEHIESVTIYAIEGDGVVSLGSITTHFDNNAGGCDGRCTDISGDVVIDAKSSATADTFYPLVLRVAGVRQGRRPFKGTYRFLFDRQSFKYTTPPNMPDDIKP